MADSFSELRSSGGSTRPWTIGSLAALAVAVLAALASAGYSLSRPSSERSPIPQVVTVTAQPTEPATQIPQVLSPGTYTGWLLSTGESGESGWNAMLTVGGDSAMLAYPAKRCAIMLNAETDGADGQWNARSLTKGCGSVTESWSLREAAPGVIELDYAAHDGGRVHGSLSAER